MPKLDLMKLDARLFPSLVSVGAARWIASPFLLGLALVAAVVAQPEHRVWLIWAAVPVCGLAALICMVVTSLPYCTQLNSSPEASRQKRALSCSHEELNSSSPCATVDGFTPIQTRVEGAQELLQGQAAGLKGAVHLQQSVVAVSATASPTADAPWCRLRQSAQGPLTDRHGKDAPVTDVSTYFGGRCSALPPGLPASGCPSSPRTSSNPKAAPAPRTPVCLLSAATDASCASSLQPSLDDSGCANESAAIVESVAAIAAVARGPLRYRSAASCRRSTLHIKMPHVEPHELQPGFVAAVNASLAAHGTGVQVVGACVRRGCVELTLDLVERAGAAGTAGVLGGGHGASSHVALSSLVLSALGCPPSQPGKCRGAAAAVAQPDVLVQCGGQCWALQWDPTVMQWQVQVAAPGSGEHQQQQQWQEEATPSGNSSGGATDDAPSVFIFAPSAVLVLPGAATARITMACIGDAAWQHAPPSASSPADVPPGALVAPGSPSGSAAPLRFLARGNGRSVPARLLSVTPATPNTSPAGRSATPTPSPRHGGGAQAVLTTAPVHEVEVEVDVAALSAGRPRCSPGLVLRLELWRGARVADSASVACLVHPGLVEELGQLQVAGGAEPGAVAAAVATVSPFSSFSSSSPLVQLLDTRGDMEQLLADLGSWLDLAAHRGPGAQGQGQGAAGADPEDLSGQVRNLMADPRLQQCVEAGGRALLQHFVSHGLVGLACWLHGDLARGGVRLGSLVPWAGEAGEQQQGQAGRGTLEPADADARPPVSLLHHAVRSGRYDMVQAVLRWAAEVEAEVPGGPSGAALRAWSCRCPGGLTPLHLLAADARSPEESRLCSVEPPEGVPAGCGGGALLPGALDALLRAVLGAWPDAVTVWNTARDDGGNTPAGLWAALGGQDIQPQLAAQAVASLVPDDDGAFAAPSTSPAAAASAHCGSLTAAPAGAGACTHHRPTLQGLLRSCVFGFSGGMETKYVSYVTRSNAYVTLLWLGLMVAAHAAAFYKSLSTGDSRQAIVGGAAYGVSLAVMLLRPALYQRAREPLMMSCLLGRTLARLLMSTLPAYFHMSGSVIKYIVYGLDILLDGLLEGAFEQVRLPYAAAGRLVEWPVTAGLYVTHSVYGSWPAALLRSAATSLAGLATTAAMDLRLRAAFLRAERRAAGGKGGKAKAE